MTGGSKYEKFKQRIQNELLSCKDAYASPEEKIARYNYLIQLLCGEIDRLSWFEKHYSPAFTLSGSHLWKASCCGHQATVMGHTAECEYIKHGGC